MPEESTGSFFQELKRRNVFRVAIAFGIASWLILQIVDVVLPLLDLPEWVSKLILLMLIVSFPIAIILAWAFEMTPEGVKLEKNVDRSQSITTKTGRKLDFTIIAVLVVALGISVYLNVGEEGEVTGEPVSVSNASVDIGPPSIAILPFANRSANENDAFFVDGMHDDLLTQMAKISAFKVISRTSVMQYRDSGKPMPVIGEELGVSTIVEGGVQRSGDRIRINIQLIEAATDEHIWAETYNRELTAANIFEIQEEITAEIAGALHAELTPEDQQRLAVNPTDNLAAYEAYLFGRQLIDTRISGKSFDAEAQFKHAIELDPGFELAHVALGETYMIQNNLGVLSKSELLEKLDEFSLWANDLDNKSGEVYNVLAGRQEYNGNYVRAKEYYLKAVELSPQYALAQHWLALLYVNFTGELEEAIEIYQDVLKLDPLNEIVRANLSFLYVRNGDFEAAQAELKRGLAVNVMQPQTINTLGGVYYVGFSDAATAMRLSQKATQLDANYGASVAALYGNLGDSESAARWLQPHREKYPDEADGVATEMDEKLRAGDAAGAVELAVEALTMSRDIMPAAFPLRVMQDEYFRQGRAGELLGMYADFYPALLYEEPEVHQSNVGAALGLLSVHLHLGDEAAAAQLSDIILTQSKIWPTVGVFGPSAVSAEVYALNGEIEASVAEISRLLNAGWIIFGADRAFDGSGMADLRADAEFQTLIEANDVKVAEQLAQIRQLEEDGMLARYPEQLPILNIDVSSLIN
jgi:TolB-like protein/Tfp pilus assembly protein PilF